MKVSGVTIGASSVGRVGVALLCLASNLALAQVENVDSRQFAEMKELVRAYITNGLTEMFKENDVVDYWQRPTPKALAACVDWNGVHFHSGRLMYALQFLDVDSPIRYYEFTSGGKKNEVRERAMGGCETRSRMIRNICSCHLLYMNSDVVYDVPPDIIQRLWEEKIEDSKPAPIRPPGKTWRND